MTAVEVTLEDFETYEEDEDGYVYRSHDFPPELEFDNAHCSTPDCGAPIGWGLGGDDPDTGAPLGWSATTFRLPDGRYVCEDCAIEHDESIK